MENDSWKRENTLIKCEEKEVLSARF